MVGNNADLPVPGIDFPGSVLGCVTKAVPKQDIFAAMLKANTPRPSSPRREPGLFLFPSHQYLLFSP